MTSKLNIVFAGLSITSSWGNGHATTYRSLIKALHRRGHNILFLERDTEWYAGNRDMPHPPFCETAIYGSVQELKEQYVNKIKNADIVVFGSFVPDGVEVGAWILDNASHTAFYDIDTPVTLGKLKNGETDYISKELVSKFDIYFSFSGGKVLHLIKKKYNAPLVKALYCSVDPEVYYPSEVKKKYDLGYIGTYSEDRQPALEKMLIEPASMWPEGKFIIAGPMYPDNLNLPSNVETIVHLSPQRHNEFYNSQRFTLNITRTDMIALGYSPSVRLFEAAACGVPIISDYWEGLDSLFDIGKDILVSRSLQQTLNILRNSEEEERKQIGENGRKKILAGHTSEKRAEEFEMYVNEILSERVF